MSRPLNQTHPFIDFLFTTKCIDAKTWMRLGEALSKCEQLAGAPLKPAAADELAIVHLARGVQATTAIEGNTLSTAEVVNVVRTGSAGVGESRAYLEQEVRNVLAVIREIDDSLRDGLRLPISKRRLRDLNIQVLDGIPDRPEVVPGQFRGHDVTAGPYKAPHFAELDSLVERFVAWLGKLRTDVGPDATSEERFVNSVLTAVVAHVYIAWIHPFGNGNGRVARLIEVQILSESGVVPLVATNLLSDHYNKTRDAYYLALDAAQQDIGRFIRYAVQGFVDELRDQIKTVRRENLDVHWESYVYEKFRSLPRTQARDRQREIALSMPLNVFLTPDQVTAISASLARRFAMCGERTPARDMNALTKAGLMEKRGRKYRVRRQDIEAFMPPVSQKPTLPF